jgi:hypothetical protein
MKLLLALFAAVILTVPPVVQAQNAQEYGDEVVRQLAAKQVVLSLESEYAHVRAQTLKNVIVFSTLYRDQIDLRPAVKSIAEIAESDVSDQNRSLGLAALQAIGSFRARQHLEELQVTNEDEHRMLVANVLNEYYTKPDAM